MAHGEGRFRSGMGSGVDIQIGAADAGMGYLNQPISCVAFGIGTSFTRMVPGAVYWIAFMIKPPSDKFPCLVRIQNKAPASVVGIGQLPPRPFSSDLWMRLRSTRRYAE